MPALPSDISLQVFSNAKELPAAVWKVLEDHPIPANVVLPQALKAREGYRAVKSSNLWIVCTTNSTIEFILSVTEGPMGAYPVFIFTPLPLEYLVDSYIRPCIRSMVVALAAAIPVSRVYSIFSVEPVTVIFASEWRGQTSVELADDPVYYAAKISYCTIDTLDKRSSVVDASKEYVLRPASREDIESIGELCYYFASDSHPFILTKEGAQLEASILVKKKVVWVHEAKNSMGQKEIASIVAFTRNSNQVATITKVCTNERWQRKGCAERLVRRVCEHLLTGPNRKESVVLYVAHDNIAANVVYDRVGFTGLAQSGPKVTGVAPWLEIGFDRKKVVLGHW
ncbi:hypothetical protein H0H87_004814 [Tephrocybe sp. NHM501043]|nr:hypothetical protein H0H87_004814 [Tephrocybe sp. NHM501043]